jgi:hypothetical protein
MVHQRLLGKLQCRDGLGARHAGEVLKELIEGLARLQGVKQAAGRNASADEDRGATQEVGVVVDRRKCCTHERFSFTRHFTSNALHSPTASEFSGATRLSRCAEALMLDARCESVAELTRVASAAPRG